CTTESVAEIPLVPPGTAPPPALPHKARIPRSTPAPWRPGTPSRGPASVLLVHAATAALTPVLGAGPRSGAPGHQFARRESVDPGLVAGERQAHGRPLLGREVGRQRDLHDLASLFRR